MWIEWLIQSLQRINTFVGFIYIFIKHFKCFKELLFYQYNLFYVTNSVVKISKTKDNVLQEFCKTWVKENYEAWIKNKQKVAGLIIVFSKCLEYEIQSKRKIQSVSYFL